jgi:prophage DNA circulation protein
MIQDARYTSPSGNEINFEWESGKRKTELKTGIFTFPGRDGAHVQHQGAGARSFPLVCIFSGNNYMGKADTFENMLIERGVGELQHPTYGILKVVPTGDIEREDDPVNRYGESTVTITFTETIVDEETDELAAVAAIAIEEMLNNFEDAAVSDFAKAVSKSDISTKYFLISSLNDTVKNITGALSFLASLDTKILGDWLSAVKELTSNIENMLNTGLKIVDMYSTLLDIGRLALRIMKLPSTIAVSLAEKIKGYSTLTADLINQYKNDPFGIEKIKAAYASASLAITGACAAIASGSAMTIAEISAKTGVVPENAAISGYPSGNIKAGTISRENAVETAGQIAVFFETVKDFQDKKIETLNIQNAASQDTFIDADPTAHLALAELVQMSIQLILNASFALPLQKTIILDRDRQVVELCAELYGNTDFIDELIIQNNFNIDEIELLPMGRKVSYYVKST